MNNTEILQNVTLRHNGIITAEELLNMDFTEVPYLIESLFPKQGLVAIGGSSDTGKSTLVRQLAMSIVSGEEEFLGYKLNSEHNRVLYVSTEDYKDATSVALKKQQAEFGLANESFKNLTFIFNTDNLETKIDYELKKQPHDLVVIDAFADLFREDMNQVNQVRNYLHEYGQLAYKYKCLFLFVHHTGKGSEYKIPNKNNLLGSQGFEGRMRSVALLVKDKKDVRTRYLCLVKGNYLKENQKTEALELIFNDNLTFQSTGRTSLFEELKSDEDKESKKKEILNLQKQGLSQKKIGERLGISQTTVSRCLAKH